MVDFSKFTYILTNYRHSWCSVPLLEDTCSLHFTDMPCRNWFTTIFKGLSWARLFFYYFFLSILNVQKHFWANSSHLQRNLWFSYMKLQISVVSLPSSSSCVYIYISVKAINIVCHVYIIQGTCLFWALLSQSTWYVVFTLSLDR